jgi:hypothetical protein
MGVARELLDENLPDPGQRRILLGLVMVPLVLGLVNLFANLVARKVVKMMREEGE